MSADDLHKYVDGAVRMTLDSVSFSNPLPPWEDMPQINFGRRTALIHKRADDYLSAADSARPPTRVRVPRKDGPAKTWIIPSVNDQIILQLCAFALSERLERVIASFLRFLREATGDVTVPVLLERVLQRLAPPSEGLPLINDSVFYLGNAYLTVVDKEIAAVSRDFIRFVDDYRVFADSKEHLDSLLLRINERLARTSFRINPRKTRVGDENEYLSAISKIRDAKTEGENGYVSAVELSGVVDPGTLAALIARTIFRPEDLTEGMGRFLMQAVRRMRLNDDWVKGRNLPDSPLRPFGQALALAVPAEAVGVALQKYANSAEEWRFIWVLYVAEDLGRKAMGTFVKSIDSSVLSPVARAWLARARGGAGQKLTIDQQHDMPYGDAGRALYGTS